MDAKQLACAHTSLILANNFAPVSEALYFMEIWVYRIAFLLLLVCSFFANACGEESDYSPLLELGEVKKNYIKDSKLFIPLKINTMELATVLFEIGNDKNLVLPIKFYVNSEYPEIHKDGYATILHTVTEANINNITVHVNYTHPTKLDGEITFCFHTETFKLSELN